MINGLILLAVGLLPGTSSGADAAKITGRSSRIGVTFRRPRSAVSTTARMTRLSSQMLQITSASPGKHRAGR